MLRSPVGDFGFADEVKFPAVAVPDGPYLLSVLRSRVRSCLVLCEHEVRAVFQVEAFARTGVVVLGIVLDAGLPPRHGGAWVVVAPLSIAEGLRVGSPFVRFLNQPVNASASPSTNQLRSSSKREFDETAYSR